MEGATAIGKTEVITLANVIDSMNGEARVDCSTTSLVRRYRLESIRRNLDSSTCAGHDRCALSVMFQVHFGTQL
jgi:hypothetical protein